ncbi:Helix-turn-helix domain [Mycobacteroides abscessus subsp. abscessus]|uniref:helix-turn-helix transcriptional regulator n=1 Tax=Mycobacteroides abscessus TaxID=36809 RepID=UPI0009A6D9CB|nr:helix-turn-helix domain-containing protein [Mycobacteroides abscessus]SKV12386.1 Helix-turn-helix domain [Mycobacteroides abscessus subsp. abscessus]
MTPTAPNTSKGDTVSTVLITRNRAPHITDPAFPTLTVDPTVRLKFLRPTVAADYLGLSVETLRLYRRRGIGPAYHTLEGTRTVLYSVEDLDAWVRAQTRHEGKNRRASVARSDRPDQPLTGNNNNL